METGTETDREEDMANANETAYVSVVTRTTVDESGSSDPNDLGVACVGVAIRDDFYFFGEESLTDLVDILKQTDRVVGVSEFVAEALEPYDGVEDIEIVGVLEAVNRKTGRRVSFNNVTKNSLGEERPDMRSLSLDWRSGDIEGVRHGLKKDLRLLRRIDEKIHTDGRVTVRDPETFEEISVEVI